MGELAEGVAEEMGLSFLQIFGIFGRALIFMG